MEQKLIDRINELARKSRVADLTKEEKDEQQTLRNMYLDSVRKNFKQTLNNIQIVDNDKCH